MMLMKTIVPRRQDHWLSRQRLLDQLYPGEKQALSLIVAPTGHGKTTLLTDFARQARFAVCWLSLDKTDRDVHTFASYFSAALQHRFPGFGELTRQALSAGAGRVPVALADAVIRDVQENVPDPFALVLDDYHLVDDSSEVGDLLTALLERRPERFYLVVASETPPGGLPIIQFTAQGQIVFVGEEPLAFTADEAQALLEKMRVELSPQQVEALVTRHKGHVAYILLSITLHAASDQPPDAPALDYAGLIEWAFMQQPVPLRDTLMALSTLHEMSDARCQEALGLSGTAAVLQNLKQRDIFVTTVLDEKSGVTWFRFHPPIRDFLQAQFQAHDEAHFCQLHQRAADWMERHDSWPSARERWERAVAHRLAASDLHAAARTMEIGAKPMFYARRGKTLVAWYEALPESLRLDFPGLLLYAGRAMFDLGHTDEALPLLHRAEAIFDQRGETERALLAVLARATVQYAWGHHADVLALAQGVLPQAASYPTLASEARRWAGLACLDLGRPEEAVEHLRAALDLFRELGSNYETAISYRDLSFALSRLGKLEESLDCLEQAIKLFRSTGPSSHLAVALNNVACERYYLAGDYGRARAYLCESLDVAQAIGSPPEQALALLSTADLYRDLGALRQARELYDQAEELARQAGHAALVNYALMGIAQLLLQTGDVIEALGLAIQAHERARERGDVYQLGLSSLTLGSAQLEAGDLQAALDEIERGRERLAKSGARRDLTRAYVLLARARQVSGDQEGALQALSQALDVGIETQTFHHLVVEGQRVFDLFRDLRQRNRGDRRTAHVMARIQTLPDTARDVVGGIAPTALPYTPKLRLYGFGPGRAEIDGHVVPVAAWHSRMPRRLVFYLLLESPCSLDQILDVFWPGVERSAARPIFHVIKQRINRAVERRLVVFEEGKYRIAWDPDCWFDVRAFESLLNGRDGRLARLKEAVALYQGDFLADYDAEWCIPIREHLSLRYRNALVELGELYMERRDFAEGFMVLCRATPQGNLYEPASRALMRLYASDGRRESALKHYENLVEYLRQDVGTVPAPATRTLYRAIRKGASAAQLARLAQTFDRVSA
jgi:LuxR family maltose regulon positive regulatory protein